MRTITKAEAVGELDQAVRHPRAANRHIKRVLRWAVDPTNATLITSLLNTHNGTLVQAIDAEDHLDDYSVLGVLFRTGAARMLSEADVSMLESALNEAIGAYIGFSAHLGKPTTTPGTLDGVSMVRVAYVLARDLNEVEFEDGAIEDADPVGGETQETCLMCTTMES